MRITMLTIGSRGDVEPYIALGAGLQEAGHDIRLATHTHFQSFVEEWGLDYHPIAGDPRDAISEEAGQNWLEAGRNPLTFMRRLMAVARPMMWQMLDDYWAACEDAELILYPVLATLAAITIGEKMGTPACPAYLQAIHPTRAYPFALAKPPPQLGAQASSLYNRFTHWSSEQIFWQVGRPIINQWRTQTLKLSSYPWASPFMKLLRARPYCLYGYSPSVLPKPHDWPANAYVTGYWYLNQGRDWQPPADLADFLGSGPPPVYIGFGSMSTRDPEQLTDIALRALAQSGQRGILLTGWGGLSNADLPDTVFKIEAAPHDWLFPRMAAVVHHGGAGTTAAGLRAGIPAILIPFFADQPFWAWRVKQLGVGPDAIPRKHLSTDRLVAAITQAVTDPALQQRATDLGERIRTEDGVAVASSLIHSASTVH